jgi:flavin reductase (DIM6/NTAB) family NADH-FMN oxidoreductase RutF
MNFDLSKITGRETYNLLIGPPGTSEVEEAGFTTEPSTLIAVPRIAQSPASREYREYATIEIGKSRIILGMVVSIKVRDDLIYDQLWANVFLVHEGGQADIW